jgi:hypothetical protein
MHNTKVIENFETFPESTNTSPSDKWVKSYGHWKLEKESVLGRSNWLANFGFSGQFQMKSGRTLITKILENFIALLTRGRTLTNGAKS